ncbi:MAG: hypothetical protein R3B07_14605 [Polyangiaceae bacterium]
MNGDPHYCTNPSFPCAHGEGDCDSDAECEAGTVCKAGVGAQFGLPAGTDVCVSTGCGNKVWDANECGVDCGGTSGCGTCSIVRPNKGPSCGGVNGDPHYCTNPNFPCAHGEGDCDSDAECEPGTVCKPGVGAQFGLPAGTDVCVSTGCSNGLWDANECGVDCGGTSGCGACSVPRPNKGPSCGGVNGDPHYCTNPNFPCGSGEGDCDSDAECASGLVCGSGNGVKFGLGGVDVCVASTCLNGVLDANEAGVDCGGTSGCGQCANAGAHVFSKIFGDSGVDQRARGVALDSAGNIIVVGYFSGTINFGGSDLVSAGGRDVFLAKFDSSGNHLWSKRFGGTKDAFGLGVAVDTTNSIIITGYFSGTASFGGANLVETGNQQDVFLAKYNSAGVHQFSKRFGDAPGSQQGWSVATNAGNQIFLTGFYRSTIDFSNGALATSTEWSTFVASFNSSGSNIAAKSFGDLTNVTQARSIAVDSAGNLLLTGQFSGSANFGGGTLSTNGGFDTFVVKLSSSLAHRYSKRFGDGSADLGRRIAADGLGNSWSTGYFQGTIDFGCGVLSAAGGYDGYLVKLDSNGACLVSKRFGDSGTDAPDAIAVDGAGNVVISGSFDGAIDFGGGAIISNGDRDAFLAKFSPDGSHIYSDGFGGTGAEFGEGVAASTARVLLVGTVGSSADFGGGTLTSAGGNDAFVAAFLP